MNVIFLDVDGVLNCNFSKSYYVDERGVTYLGIDNSRVKLVAEVAKKTDSVIVLTTDWKYYFRVGAYKQEVKSAKYLNNKLRAAGLSVFDKTCEPHWSLRGRGICNWLGDHDVDGYVILDDHPFDINREGYFKSDKEYDKLRNHFILTDNNEGLQEWQAEAAVKIINGELIGPVMPWSVLN